MTWVRIDDSAATHPKLLAAGPEAAWLWVAGLCHANRHHTDGLIRKTMLYALFPSDVWQRRRRARAAEALVHVGLWVDEGHSWRIHDYAEYQEDALREHVQERREYERTRKAAQRAASRRARLGVVSRGDSPGPSTPLRPASSSAKLLGTDSSPAVSQPPDPARPDPARQQERESPLSSRLDRVDALVPEVNKALARAHEAHGIMWSGGAKLTAVRTITETLLATSDQRGQKPLDLLASMLPLWFADEKARKAGYPLAWFAGSPAQYDPALKRAASGVYPSPAVNPEAAKIRAEMDALRKKLNGARIAFDYEAEDAIDKKLTALSRELGKVERAT